MAPSSSSSSSFASLKDCKTPTETHDIDDKAVRSPRETLYALVQNVDSDELRRAIKTEIKRLITDHERLITILQQRYEILERNNDELKAMASEHQRRYEKAVREMQFFRQKYDKASELKKQYMQQRQRSASIESKSSGEMPSQQPNYPVTPTSPQHIPVPVTLDPAVIANNYPPYEPSDFSSSRHRTTLPSRSPSTSTSSSSAASVHQYWPPPSTPGPPSEPAPPVPRRRQNSTTTSVHSAQSASTDGRNTQSTSASQKQDGDPRRKRSWQANCGFNIGGPSSATSSTPFNMSTTTSISSGNSSAQSVPMTPVRSSTATNGYTGASLIQQRRVDPLIFGGSDGLWETITKSKGSDVTVEKIIR